MFYCALAEMLWQFLRNYAKSRRITITSSSLREAFHTALPSGYKGRMTMRQAAVATMAANAKEDDPNLVDCISCLNQDVGFIPPCASLPCLIARSDFMWSHCLGGFLVPCEALWAMGVQTEVSEGGRF